MVNAAAIEILRLPSHAWLEGKPLNEIERMMGGNPDGSTAAQLLPRAREFVGTVVPRSLSFALGVVARIAEELTVNSQQPDISSDLAKPVRVRPD